MHADDLRAVGAVRTLGLMRTDGWPMVAAHLVAGGADGAALVELAGLPRNTSGWKVDQLLDNALLEAGGSWNVGQTWGKNLLTLASTGHQQT